MQIGDCVSTLQFHLAIPSEHPAIWDFDPVAPIAGPSSIGRAVKISCFACWEVYWVQLLTQCHTATWRRFKAFAHFGKLLQHGLTMPSQRPCPPTLEDLARLVHRTARPEVSWTNMSLEERKRKLQPSRTRHLLMNSYRRKKHTEVYCKNMQEL